MNDDRRDYAWKNYFATTVGTPSAWKAWQTVLAVEGRNGAPSAGGDVVRRPTLRELVAAYLEREGPSRPGEIAAGVLSMTRDQVHSTLQKGPFVRNESGLWSRPLAAAFERTE